MGSELPRTYKKLVVNKLTTNFREAVSVVSAPLPQPEENEVLIKNRFVGVNATDVNVTAGRYFTTGKPPYEFGFEGIGEVVAVGKKVLSIKVGQNVAYIYLKAFAEYVSVPVTEVYSIPELKPEYVNLLISGLTASIGLDKSGRITEGETVLITAAAGGTGHIGVQWAKAAGCHVIGTCSSEKKATILKGLGCDRVINYKTENLCDVLKKEYPKGVDVVWETIGGSVFETCIENLAIKGRLLCIGGISGYKSGTGIPKIDLSSLPTMLRHKSAALQGFLLLNYTECFQTYFAYLLDRFTKGELQLLVDTGKESTGKEFVGFEGLMEAEEHLHSGKSIGKVLVRLP